MSKTFLLVVGFLLLTGCVSVARSQRPLPNPVLVFAGATPYEAQRAAWMRYHYFVFNAADYASELFSPAPDLPPCGVNKNSSRAWIDVYDQRGTRLYGFCAITDAKGLADIWFNLKDGTLPPSWIYIEINDRKTNTKYKSNLAETVL